ncbi:MAG: hypothetical protein ACJ796_04915 [Gemmatimonadaceae bacterium]
MTQSKKRDPQIDLERQGVDVESFLERRARQVATALLWSPTPPLEPSDFVNFLASEVGTDSAHILVDHVLFIVQETGEPDRWISELGRARDRGDLSPSVAHFLIYRLGEFAMQHLSSTHPVLSELNTQIRRIEREHGLTEDEFWHVNEGPPEWQALCEEYETVSDELVMDIFLRNGEREVAEAYATGDGRQFALGRAQIIGI